MTTCTRILVFATASLAAGCSGDNAGPDTSDPDGAVAASDCEAADLDWGRGGELMLPASPCLDCHRADGSASANPFSVAGTIFSSSTCPQGVQGAVIQVKDSSGERISLTSNEVGNFYTTEALVAPLTLSVEIAGEVTEMVSEAPTGSCGYCHQQGSSLGFVTGSP